MKHIFTFWLIVGFIAAIITGVVQAGEVDWTIRGLIGLYAGGLLWTFPLAVIYGVIDYFVKARKQTR